MDDVLAKSNGSHTLEFSDALEHQKYLTDEKNACIISGKNKSIIVVKQLDPITDKEELAIAHELGHLWLLSHNFPRERQYDLSAEAEQERQERYDICFGPLLEIMEHAIFYPHLKADYKINLYEPGNERLVDFIRKVLPNRKIQSDGDKISLILNYVKFKIESNENYWHEMLDRSYSRTEFLDFKGTGQKLLSIIQELARNPLDSQYFIAKYREILEVMDIEDKIWPDFAKQGMKKKF